MLPKLSFFFLSAEFAMGNITYDLMTMIYHDLTLTLREC